MACNNCTNGCERCSPYFKQYAEVNRTLNNFKLKNPIPDEVNDSKQLRNFFSKNIYVPYAGLSHDSQHTVLRFIDNLGELSPTLRGVFNSICHLSFAGKFDIMKVTDSDFDLDETETPSIPFTLKQEFVSFLKDFNLNGKNWDGIRKSLFFSYKKNGNAFLQIKITSSFGVKKVHLNNLQTQHCLYKIPDLFTQKVIAISRSWDPSYLKKYPPEEIPVYPNFSKAKDGTISTIIHIKSGENEFYGRPDWWSCSYDAFLEIKNKEYLLKAAHNNFTGQVMIEYESDQTNPAVNDKEAKDAGFDNEEARWARNFSNRDDDGRDPQSILITSRPFGSSPAFVHEFNIKTNENYFSTIDKISSDKIVMANSWSKKLVGMEGSSGLSTNAYIDELKTKLPIIEAYQTLIDNQLLNRAIGFAIAQLERKEFIGLGIESKNPFDHLLKIDSEYSTEPVKQTPDVVNN